MYYNQHSVLFLDGEYKPATQATTDLYGQTMHYGYGVFEGIRAYPTTNGTRLFKVKEHYERLKLSCELYRIPLNYSVEELTEITYKVLEYNNLTDAYVRPLVFCAPNMSLTKPVGVSVMVCAWAWGAYLGEKLLRLKIASFCRPHPRSIKIEAKVTGHYVNSILATSEAKEAGFDEALLLDSDGFLAEGPGANMFFEKNGELYTPKTGNILPGITRATVLDLAEKMGIKVNQGMYLPQDLYTADSAFYCGTAAEIVGIASVDHVVFETEWKNTLGKKLQTAYSQLVRQEESIPVFSN